LKCAVKFDVLQLFSLIKQNWYALDMKHSLKVKLGRLEKRKVS